MIVEENWKEEPGPLDPRRGQVNSILMEAHRLVHNDRQADYGHPIDDFSRTGRLWAAILGLPEVTPQQVAICMVCVKLSREVNRPKRDNRVDGSGYLETLDMVMQKLEMQEARDQKLGMQEARDLHNEHLSDGGR